MSQTNPLVAERCRYYFTRAKDTHTEENQVYITLFARLTCVNADSATNSWVELEEIKWSHAHTRLRAMPNGVHTFQVTSETFRELTELADLCYNELYYLVPAHRTATFRPFHRK